MVSSASSAVGVPETWPDEVFKLSQEGFAPTTLNVLSVGASITESNKVNAVIAEFLVKVVGIPVTVALHETSLLPAPTAGKVTSLLALFEALPVSRILKVTVVSSASSAVGVPETWPDEVFKLSQEGFAPTTLNVLSVGASITESNKVNAVIAEFLVKVVGIPVTVALQETSAVTIGKVTYLVCEPLSSVAVIITLVVKSF